MAAFVARNARVQINGAWFRAKKWTCKTRADEVDVTSFEDGGYKNILTGAIIAEVDVEGFMEDGLSPFGAPLLIFPGSLVNNVRLFMNNVAGIPFVPGNTGPATFVHFPLFTILTADLDADVNGAMLMNFSGRNKGVFTMP